MRRPRFEGPDRAVSSYLAANEAVIWNVKPHLPSWVLEQTLDLVVMFVVLGFAVVGEGGVSTLASLALLGLTGSLLWRFQERRYTRYVLTTHRVIRISGVLRRDHEWIAWSKVTDVSVRRSVFDRMVGTATILIQSANEMSGFRAMTDVPHPIEFAEVIAEHVNATRGLVAAVSPVRPAQA